MNYHAWWRMMVGGHGWLSNPMVDDRWLRSNIVKHTCISMIDYSWIVRAWSNMVKLYGIDMLLIFNVTCMTLNNGYVVFQCSSSHNNVS